VRPAPAGIPERVGNLARTVRRRLGALPAVVVVGALYALGAACALLLDDGVAGTVAIALFAVFVLYCIARPAGGWDVFTWAQLPNLGVIAHEAIGAPRALAYALIPVALLIELGLDASPERGDRPGSCAGTGAGAEEPAS